MVHVDKLSFGGDPNVGLYCVATDKFVLVGKNISKSKLEKLKDIFSVPVIQISIYNTNLIGIFVSANSKTILVPEVISKEELKDLKEKVTNLAEVKIIKTDLNALGNNILTNDKIAILNKDFLVNEVKEIKKALGVRAKHGLQCNELLPGTAGILTNKGGIFSSELTESEIAKLEKSFGFEIGLGTISMGGRMLGSGVVANSFGFIASKLSSGYEIARVDESLGFLD